MRRRFITESLDGSAPCGSRMPPAFDLALVDIAAGDAAGRAGPTLALERFEVRVVACRISAKRSSIPAGILSLFSMISFIIAFMACSMPAMAEWVKRKEVLTLVEGHTR